MRIAGCRRTSIDAVPHGSLSSRPAYRPGRIKRRRGPRRRAGTRPPSPLQVKRRNAPPSTERPAGMQCPVAQIFNLLYRGFSIRKPFLLNKPAGQSCGQPARGRKPPELEVDAAFLSRRDIALTIWQVTDDGRGRRSGSRRRARNANAGGNRRRRIGRRGR
jgi:hypothetical protein